MKLKLQRPSYFEARNGTPWESAKPFVDNHRAQLIHRPRRVTTYNSQREPHIAVSHWCGNGHNGMDNFTFLDTMEGTRKLLCAKCEANAIAAGLPSASELTGRHVHVGRVTAIQTCCAYKEPTHD